MYDTKGGERDDIERGKHCSRGKSADVAVVDLCRQDQSRQGQQGMGYT